MDTIKLAVREREETGNGPARRLRAEGRVPGVAYGKGGQATAVSITLEDMKAALAHGSNAVLELEFEGETQGSKTAAAGAPVKQGGSRYAVVKELQFHPIKRRLLHVDLLEVDLSVEIEAPVPLELIGTPAGVVDGGILTWELREVLVRALPGDLPALLEVDVSGLQVGENVIVGALEAPAGVAIVDDPELMIAAVLAPRVEEAAGEEEGAEAAAAEPEVVGEAKEEE